MSGRFGGTFLTPVLAIAAVVAAGAAGYRVVSGGCGLCHDEAGTTALVSTSTDSGSACGACPGAAAECSGAVQTASTETASGCCVGESANVKTVAATESKKEGCCSEGKTEKVCKEGTEGCKGDGKDGCCGGCLEKKAEGVAQAGGK